MCSALFDYKMLIIMIYSAFLQRNDLGLYFLFQLIALYITRAEDNTLEQHYLLQDSKIIFN